MADYTFNSGIGSYIRSFVGVKRASGYPYGESARVLHKLDAMVVEAFPEASTLTKDICNEWIRSNAGGHQNGLIRKITPVRQLGKYMNGMGIKAYVIPGNIPGKAVRYESHIYTEAELKAFFHAIDQCPYCPYSPTMCYVVPVFFRMLYCCGLRSSEARYLDTGDVDLGTGKIVIRKSKGWKSRIVYMSGDMMELCQEYNSIIEAIVPDRAAFFPNRYGKAYGKSRIDDWFHEFWDPLPEAGAVTGNPARVHSLRHTYAVNRLNRWVREGKEFRPLYPYLSEYMGHSTYKETDYYLSLVDSFYPEMEKRLSGTNEDILPEVAYEDE